MRMRLAFCMILCLYLGLQDGYLALKDDDGVHHIFPYRAEVYTEEDRALLRRGIPLPNREKLAAALEDYFS